MYNHIHDKHSDFAVEYLTQVNHLSNQIKTRTHTYVFNRVLTTFCTILVSILLSTLWNVLLSTYNN